MKRPLGKQIGTRAHDSGTLATTIKEGEGNRLAEGPVFTLSTE